MKRATGTLRIIAGEWRSRRVAFDADPAVGLRATPDRVRQPLFDWLGPFISGASCLDLFAGSGALGLEALSRGAAHSVFIDSGAQQIADIRAALTSFGALDRATLLQTEALRWLANAQQRFDVVFLDPPFGSTLIAQALPLLPLLLKPNNRIFLEWSGEAGPLPAGFEWLKDKRAGQVSYGLVTFQKS